MKLEELPKPSKYPRIDFPASVVALPSGDTNLTRWLLISATKRFPEAVSEI